MMQRCYNKDNKRYADWGARGIKVCSEWHDVTTFLKDIGPRPKGYSLDRIDNNGNYCKDNCKWASPIEQASNKRNSVKLTYNGIIDTLAGWTRRLGVKKGVLQRRYVQLNWSIEKTLTTPIRDQKVE